ncbi:MAG: SIR2 family NAD-dependent protein deacylase [Pyrinomonadaceae bacterium]
MSEYVWQTCVFAHTLVSDKAMLLSKFQNQDTRICILTGAGISAESGLPTFRGGGENAVWKGMPFEQISSVQMVNSDVDKVWEWFDYRRGVYKNCLPNAAHIALAEIETRFEVVSLITQNVDGLHNRAGSKQAIELHGNINRARCTKCGKVYLMKFDDIPHTPETCADCDAKVRPDVVLFGEALPHGTFEKARLAAENATLFLLIGTSAMVYPAAFLPELAKRNGAYLVEINPEETPLTSLCDESFRGKACEIVPNLFSSS